MEQQTSAFGPLAVPTGGFRVGERIGIFSGFPTIGDFNEDGLLEPLGFLNNGDGTFDASPNIGIELILASYPGRIHRDARVFDLDGDGHLDVIWNVYSDPSVTDSFTLILYGDGAGGFSRVEERQDINGFGETIMAADFNNDGLVDIYSPVYTHVLGNDYGYLLFNEGGYLGENAAEEWGVGLSNLPSFYRVEGAQAADVNFDGLIDMYVGSHLFLNRGDHFESRPLDNFLFDEGANLFDYDNDGDFDLILRPLNEGPRLYECVDGDFIDRGVLTGSEYIPGFGINVGDLDGNGWQDIVIGGPGMVSIFLNFEGSFQRIDVCASDEVWNPADHQPGECCTLCQAPRLGDFEAITLADLNGDGALDIIGRAGGIYVFWNEFCLGDTISFSVLGPNGEENQFGRSLRLTSLEQPDLVLARVVESGSGYLTQGQYELSFGLPVSGAYYTEVALASGLLSFVVSAHQTIEVYADGWVSIVGSDANEMMGGSSGSDVLSGGDGDDVILGSLGDDVIDGGDGTDTLDFSTSLDGIVADLSTGEVASGGFAQTLAGIENLIGTAYDDILVGDAAENVLTGGAGDDILDGGEGADTLQGGTGDDLYVVDSEDDIVLEQADEGLDVVQTALAVYTLAANVEGLIGTSDDGQTLIGNDLDNAISGGAGADILQGGLGDDLYFVGEGDTVVELEGEGYDLVVTDLAAYTLADNVEDLIGILNTGQALTGNALDNVLMGGGGADTLAGAGGNDLYLVDAGDIVIEVDGEGIDEVQTALASYTLADNVEILTGMSNAGQALTGNAGDNILSGGTGRDTFAGGLGNDTYYVGRTDIVVEGADEGIDEVRTSLATYTLTANVENLTGLSNTGQKLVGNNLNNVIRSGGGLDVLIGRGGNDTYWVSGTLDSVVEIDGEGYDTVVTDRDYALDDTIFVEEVRTSDDNGLDAILLRGNSRANTLVGNAGSNILDGGGGADVLSGLLGNDFYVVDNVNTVVIEADGGGSDHIQTSVSFVLDDSVYVESMAAKAGLAAINLTGNVRANVLTGNAGANILDGGGGADILEGLGGDDTYYVDHVNDLVYESAGQGNDTVYTTVSYALMANTAVEVLAARDAAGTDALTLTGNNLVNTLIGNAGANSFFGGGGADILIGLAGNDLYFIDDASVSVVEADNGGNDTILTSVNYTLQEGVYVETLQTRDSSGSIALQLTGNSLVNTILGNAGANVLDGGGGADVLYGFDGDDTYYIDNDADRAFEAADQGNDTIYTTVSYALLANSSIETLAIRDAASTTALTLTGNNLVNTLIGNAGANMLFGGGGADTLQGLGGDDRYYVDDIGVIVLEADGGGNDAVLTSVNFTLQEGSYVETLQTRDSSGVTAISLTGNSLVNTLLGNAGDNILDGGGGADVLQGLGGNDTYYVDNANDRVLEFSGQGDDIVYTTVSYTLLANISIETLAIRDAASTTALTLTGNNLVNTLIGNAGANLFFGGGGADTLIGLGGDDRYYIDVAGVSVVEADNGGNDVILTSVNYTLQEGVYVETLQTRDSSGSSALQLTGNSLVNTILGNAGANVLDGGGGADVLYGFGGDDIYYVDSIGDRAFEAADQGNDTVYTTVSYALLANSSIETLAIRDAASTTALTLTGNNLANTLIGNAGANLFFGGGGADTLQGLEGDDRYYIDAVGVTVLEADNGGNDAILTSVNFTLQEGSYVETLQTRDITGVSAINLTGNSLVNILYGNAGANILDGGGGADVLYGGDGDDTYYVDNAADRVYEAAGQGVDIVYTTVSYTLLANSAVETLAVRDAASTTALTLTGNNLANTLIGNAGANLFFGGGGADTLIGLEGDDRYYIDAVGVTVMEASNGGNDTILTSVNYTLGARSHVETLQTRDITGVSALSLTGNGFANTIIGNAGANIIDGGDGNDVLYGGAGADIFVFSTALGATNVDALNDFQSGVDKLHLSASIFGALGGLLAEAAFVIGGAATTALHRLVYDQATGALWYDADGLGGNAAVQFAQLKAGTALTWQDILVFGAEAASQSMEAPTETAPTAKSGDVSDRPLVQPPQDTSAHEDASSAKTTDGSDEPLVLPAGPDHDPGAASEGPTVTSTDKATADPDAPLVLPALIDPVRNGAVPRDALQGVLTLAEDGRDAFLDLGTADDPTVGPQVLPALSDQIQELDPSGPDAIWHGRSALPWDTHGEVMATLPDDDLSPLQPRHDHWEH